MESLGINFNELFLKEHGSKIYNDISNLIREENPEQYNTDYRDMIFTIAFFDYFGLTNENAIYSLTELKPNKDIKISDILKIHKNSISCIKKYIKTTVESTLKRYP